MAKYIDPMELNKSCCFVLCGVEKRFIMWKTKLKIVIFKDPPFHAKVQENRAKNQCNDYGEK
jgi:16S rRNA G966 N2-methylase RsmD